MGAKQKTEGILGGEFEIQLRSVEIRVLVRGASYFLHTPWPLNFETQ